MPSVLRRIKRSAELGIVHVLLVFVAIVDGVVTGCERYASLREALRRDLERIRNEGDDA